MQREIKFRFWNRKTKQMASWDDMVHQIDCVWKSEFQDIRNEENEIMQYTGLRDKNGKDIFEGDIVEEYLSDSEDDNYLYSGVIVYFNTEFCLKIKSDTYIKLVNTGDNLEIIGNKYENPDLLSTQPSQE